MCIHQSSTQCQPRRWYSTSMSFVRTLFCCMSWNSLWLPASMTSKCCIIVMTHSTQTARSAQCVHMHGWDKHIFDPHKYIYFMIVVEIVVVIITLTVLCLMKKWQAQNAVHYHMYSKTLIKGNTMNKYFVYTQHSNNPKHPAIHYHMYIEKLIKVSTMNNYCIYMQQQSDNPKHTQ